MKTVPNFHGVKTNMTSDAPENTIRKSASKW